MRSLFSLSSRESDRGQAIVIVALVMAGLLFMVGFAMDAGMLFVARRTQQAAADAAAWAGAVELYAGKTSGAARDAAVLDAFKNGYSTSPDVTVTVYAPPLTGNFAGDLRFVEVIIERKVGTVFLRGPLDGLSLVRARAVGGAMPFQSTHAVLALDSAGETFVTNGNGEVRATGGGVKVNSFDAVAAKLNGNGGVWSPYNHVGGGYQAVGSAGFTPAPQSGLPLDADPYRTLPEPSTDGMAVYRNVRVTGTVTLEPGVYEGGIKVTANGTAKLQSGIYVLRGGGIEVTGNGSVQGVSSDTGVMLFNTYSNYPNEPVNACGDIRLAGNGVLDVRAMQTGVYAGVLLWQDNNCTNDANIVGNGALTTLVGTVYAAGAHVRIAGNGVATLSLDAQFISNTMEWSGNGNLQLNWASGKVGRPILPTLVE